MNSEQKKTIAVWRTSFHKKTLPSASYKINWSASANPVIDWHVKGLIQPAAKKALNSFMTMAQPITLLMAVLNL
jgi:hypothetical protein